MSKKINWNESWLFTKDAALVRNNTVVCAEGWEAVNLPHTWNGKDGQDGGSDYYRSTCYYTKKLCKCIYEGAQEVYIEFEGANSSADVYVNGRLAVHHDGGYSTFRANITEFLSDETEIVVAVDNAPNDRVYPQMADFTFYGGIYRNVNILCVPEARFDLDYFGGPGITVTPVVEGSDAKVDVTAYFTGLKGTEHVKFAIKDGDSVIAETVTCAKEGRASFVIKNAHLWNGRRDPFLYTLEAVLTDNKTELDSRNVKFGCRYFEIDPERGFILNGKEYPLRGVSRHQDRPEIGNALLPEHHKEDLDLIYEVGATTIRLAHYQHNQYFYDLCDEMGFVLWAEIPYISNHMPNGRENTISQMKELIIQNYNHPSIFVWGLSNEITMKGADDPDLLENHRILNDLCHEMDKTRLTTMAVVSMCPMDGEYVTIPDTVSWNHYFGWYGGDTSMNGPWMDRFHEMHPNLPVGMSEYGCEALNWHTSDPQQGDYTEEYQAYYHEELIKQLFTRPYIWATHVWNMFDFAADARSEGGEDGMNHKGLVTFDRKYKKDAFYAYKAWLSEEPFVHICGKRYVDRVEDVTKVTVYSNQPEVELFANGVSLGKQTSEVHFFYFDVPNAGTTELIAKAGECEDKSKIVKVDKFNDSYRMVETGDVLNWFEITAPEGYFSINDKMGDLLKNPAGREMMLGTIKAAMGGKEGMVDASAMMENEAMLSFMAGFTIKRLMSMMGPMGAEPLSKEQMLAFNAALNKIEK
ncbi:MAG: glycoside hydrolase family 2 protein [Lachnospiraceae bacterium]|nr:glycoside hydrolase family 2 protein [Lachnospiraceae bacterium]